MNRCVRTISSMIQCTEFNLCGRKLKSLPGTEWVNSPPPWTLLSSQGQKEKIKKRGSESELHIVRVFPSLPARCVLYCSAGISTALCGTKRQQSANWWETQWCSNCFCVLISPSRLHAVKRETFEGENFRANFCGYTRKFSPQNLDRGVLWRGKSELSAKVFSLDSFPLYSIQRGASKSRNETEDIPTNFGFAVCRNARQCRSHHIWSGQVGSARVKRYTLGGSGGMLPQKKFEI